MQYFSYSEEDFTRAAERIMKSCVTDYKPKAVSETVLTLGMI